MKKSGVVLVGMATLAMVGLSSPVAAEASRGVAVDIDFTPADDGYWITYDDGRVIAHNAPDLSDPPSLADDERITSLSPTPTGIGYWLFSDRGRAFAFGDAPDLKDLTEIFLPDGRPVSAVLNGPIVGSTATPTGLGYWMVASDGGIFAFGDADFYGSMGSTPLNQPIIGIAPTETNSGYWLIGADGGVFSFGDAGFYGSMGGTPLNAPVTNVIPQGDGYMLVASDGGIFAFGETVFHGALGGQEIPHSIATASVREDKEGYVLVDGVGKVYGFGEASPVEGPRVVISRVGISGVRFGDRIDDLRTDVDPLLGRPTRIYEELPIGRGYAEIEWLDGAVGAVASTVYWVFADRAETPSGLSIETPAGVRVGDPTSAAVAAYPGLDDVCGDGSLWVDGDRYFSAEGGQIYQIGVFSGGLGEEFCFDIIDFAHPMVR